MTKTMKSSSVGFSDAIPEVPPVSYLHVALPHHDLCGVGVLDQLLQGLRVNVVQRHVGLPALGHLICRDVGDTHPNTTTSTTTSAGEMFCSSYGLCNSLNIIYRVSEAWTLI